MNGLNDSELDALISLLEDPDEEIFSTIRNKLLSLGHDVIPALEHKWENTFNNTLQTRIEDIIQSIQFREVEASLRLWADTGGTDLLSGTLLISKYQYPDLTR